MHSTQKTKLISLIIALLCLLMGALMLSEKNSVPNRKALAEGEYLEILPTDFEVEKYEDLDLYSIITVNYVGQALLPQGALRQRYSTQNILIQTNLGTPVLLEFIQAANSASKIAFNFTEIPNAPSAVAFDSSINKLIFHDGLTIDAHADFSSTYAGIIFKGDTVFEKDSDTWKTVVESETVPTGSSVSLNGSETVNVAWNDDLERLEAKIALPYTAEADVTYTGEVAYAVSGAEYSNTVTAQQFANESVLTLIFENSEVFRVGTGISLTLSESTLTSEEYGELELTDEITFYGYSDGEWLSEECLEIRKTDGEEITVEKLPMNTTVYIFPQATEKAGSSFLGWVYEGGMYRVGDELTIPQNTKVLTIEARYLAYSLLDGASIRYGANAADSGIRFSATLTSTSFEENAEFIHSIGIILMPTDKIVPDKEFTYENYSGDIATGHISRNKGDISFNASGIFKFNVAIVRLLNGNYNRSFSARVYTIVEYENDREYVWENKIESRSLYEVASNALKDENKDTVFTSDQITLLKSYVNSIADIRYAGANVTIVNATETPIITAASVTISEDGIITIVATTTVERFFGVIYNGIRIRNAGQRAGDGTVTISFMSPSL